MLKEHKNEIIKLNFHFIDQKKTNPKGICLLNVK